MLRCCSHAVVDTSSLQMYQMYAEEFKVANAFHLRALDVDRGVVAHLSLPLVYNHLLCFTDVQGELVV